MTRTELQQAIDNLTGEGSFYDLLDILDGYDGDLTEVLAVTPF